MAERCTELSPSAGLFPFISCAVALPAVLCRQRGTIGRAPWCDLNSSTRFGNQAEGVLVGRLGCWVLREPGSCASGLFVQRSVFGSSQVFQE